MATKNVPAVKKTTAVANYVDRMAALAQEAVEQEKSVSSGSFISFKSGRISFQGNTIKGDELDVIVIDSVLENCYYPGVNDSDNPAPPVCYAFGRDEKTMAPHAESSSPQSELCSECQWNKFESAEQGRGKACKNVRRLALLPSDAAASAEAVGSAEMAFAKIPVTSVKGWATYVRGLSTLEKKPPIAVITTIGTVPDDKSQFKVTFNKAENVDSDLLPALLDRFDAVKGEIMFPYPAPSEEQAKPAGRGAKKPAAKARKY